MQGAVARACDEVIGPWSAASRLNPAQAALEHSDDPDVAASLAFTKEYAPGRSREPREGGGSREPRLGTAQATFPHTRRAANCTFALVWL